MCDLVEKRWCEPQTAAVDAWLDVLQQSFPPGAELGRVTEGSVRKTGLPSGLPVYAGSSDGQCAGLGTGYT
jgi:sugar (pentulose or hexulose) kinase